MLKVAVFGNAGAGKSTLSRRLAEVTGLPLYPLDKLQFPDGRYRREDENGGKLAPGAFASLHDELIRRQSWIIDGYGTLSATLERIAAADTLVFIDLPVPTLYLGVVKRLLQGLRRTPEGWPEQSPMYRSTLDSLRIVRLCHRQLTPRYRQLVAEAAPSKRVHHLRSRAETEAFLRAVEKEHRS